MLSPEGVPLNRRYYAEETGRDLDDDQMIRGYETEKGKYVVVTDEELEKLAPEKSRDIDLRRFVDQNEIPPMYFERGYYLTPARGTEKAYRLLAKIMEESGRVGIGTFVMRGKEYLVAITSENGILVAQTLRFPDEIRSPADVGLPKKKKVPKAELTKFERFIASHSENRLSEKELKDEQTDRMLKLVKSKKSRGKDIVESDAESTDEGNVVDIMDVLKKSLAAGR
jgi:DNA end-binding protein Ku